MPNPSDGINVLSLCDGKGCGRIALEREGIKVNKYFASEIDPKAIKVAMHNYPDIIQLGNLLDIVPGRLPHIDLIIAGSPCQGFSQIGGQLNFSDERSKLFFEFVGLYRYLQVKNKNIKMLLENVKMRAEWEKIITEYLGVEPIKINSSLVSAQDRKRFYWTNIEGVTQPDDKGILLQDILTEGVAHRKKSKCVRVGGRASFDRHEWDRATVDWRRLNRVECCRLQTVPEHYLDCVSENEAIKLLGNGWTVDVICHILSFYKQTLNKYEMD
jgi:site-specific DNA-cytosine methylase